MIRFGRVLPTFLLSVVLGCCAFAPARVFAQAAEGALSEKEVDSLRDAAYTPMERILVYVKILDSRQKWIDELVHGPHRLSTAGDLHDAIDQFAQVADELNDNLDQYSQRHRDVRKSLPKLVEATERWSTSLRAAAEDDHFNVVRRIALDAVKDTRQLADQMKTEQEAYFKAHPDAEAAEKDRRNDPHAPVARGEP